MFKLMMASLVFVGIIAAAPAGELAIGDPAPQLELKQFVKGKPVAIQKGELYVIEFWATWCGPCVESIPHLTELQKKLAEGLAKIDPHHRLLGRPMSYRVIDGTMLEITFRDVTGIAEAEALGVKRIIGDCFCSVSPQTAEQLIVRFVVPLK